MICQEKKSLLGTDTGATKTGVMNNNYGALGCGSPRLCLIFNDTFLGGKRSSWLTRLKGAGFEVEQASPRYVAISAPEDMLHRIALAKGSHGAHTMPATRERALHLLLSQFDESLGTFLSPPGPFSRKLKKVSCYFPWICETWVFSHRSPSVQNIYRITRNRFGGLVLVAQRRGCSGTVTSTHLFRITRSFTETFDCITGLFWFANRLVFVAHKFPCKMACGTCCCFRGVHICKNLIV